MIFTVDVGNTNIVLGAFENDQLRFTSRVATEASKMEDQYAIEFADIIRLYGYSPSDCESGVAANSTTAAYLVPGKGVEPLTFGI